MVEGTNLRIVSQKRLPDPVFSDGFNSDIAFEALDKSSIQGWGKVIDCLNFDSQAKLVESNKFLEFSPDLFDINFFISIDDYNIINKFQGNEFVNFNMNLLLDGLYNVESFINFDNGVKFNLHDLSDYLINTFVSLY